MNYTIYAIIGIILLLIVLLSYLNLQVSKKNKKWKNKLLEMVRKIDKYFEVNDLHKHRYALIEMDKILDHALIKTGMKGETMGERLKNANNIFDRNSYEKIWSAHKLRNSIVHDIDTTVSSQKLKQNYSILRFAVMQLIK